MLSMAACQSVLPQAVLLLSLWRSSIVLQHGIARQTNKEREGEVSSMHGHTHTIECARCAPDWHAADELQSSNMQPRWLAPPAGPLFTEWTTDGLTHHCTAQHAAALHSVASWTSHMVGTTTLISVLLEVVGAAASGC
jgi:hypothetical protein